MNPAVRTACAGNRKADTMIQHEELTHLFRDPPVLDTPRLYLRKMLKKDSADMYEYACQKEVTRYLLWEPHESEAYSQKYLSYLQSRYRAGDFYDWAVIWRETGKMIGTCGFTRFNTDANSAELGYVLNPSFWGMGIAPEAVRAVMRFGFTELQLHRLEARYMVGNDQSRRVMEKVGMTFEGVNRDSMFVKGNYVSIGICAILLPDYRKLYGTAEQD